MAHLFILLSCKIDIVCVWISNMDSIEICFQGFTNDVVGLNESIFYCQKILWQKILLSEIILYKGPAQDYSGLDLLRMLP